jgi:drug/metabolite transporter (DMT)-like permease
MAVGNLIWKIYPTRLEAMGIAIGVIGVLLLTQGSGFQSSTSGLIAVMVACTTWCVGSLLTQHRFPLADGAMGFASEMMCGGVVLIVIAAITGEYPTFTSLWPPQPIAITAWGYLVVFGSLIAFNAYMVLLTKTSAAISSSYCFVNPVIAMLLGVMFANEIVSRFEWFAVGITLFGVLLLLVGRRPQD